MGTISLARRMRRALLPMLALTVAVVCVGIAAEAAASAPPSSAIQKLAACMKAKGYTDHRSTAAYKKADQACASLRTG